MDASYVAQPVLTIVHCGVKSRSDRTELHLQHAGPHRGHTVWERGQYLCCPSETSSANVRECAHQYDAPAGLLATGR